MNDKVNVRMCIHCRRMISKEHLLRVANINDEAVIDSTKKSRGRGAYVCSVECLEASQKARKLERALKCKVGPEIYDELRDVLKHGE